MFIGGNISALRTTFYLISGLLWLGSWINVTRLIAKKKNWFIAILITLPFSLIFNFLIIKIFGINL